MELTKEEMCARIEDALRALAPGPYERRQDGDVFLALPAPSGPGIEYRCDDQDVRLDFGPAGGYVHPYVTEDEDGRDTFDEEALKDILKDLVRTTLDITSEKVFAATFKKNFFRTGGLYPVAGFDALSRSSRFQSQSWKGKYTRSFP